MMGLEVLPGLVSALSPTLHPLGILAVIFLGIGFTVWRTIRAFHREDEDAYSKRMGLLDARSEQLAARTKAEMERLAKRCDVCDARLEVVEALLRDAMRANYLIRVERDCLKVGRDSLRRTIACLYEQVGKPPPVWPADATT